VTGDFHSFSLSALTAAPRVHPRSSTTDLLFFTTFNLLWCRVTV